MTTVVVRGMNNATFTVEVEVVGPFGLYPSSGKDGEVWLIHVQSGLPLKSFGNEVWARQAADSISQQGFNWNFREPKEVSVIERRKMFISIAGLASGHENQSMNISACY